MRNIGSWMLLIGLFAVSLEAAPFTPIPLKEGANTGFTDTVADDQKGGWLDLGGNDLRVLKPGGFTFCQVPFDILDGREQDQKSCIVLGGPRRAYLPSKAELKVGLAVWHVDEKKKGNTDEGYPGQEGWPQNNRHFKIALLQADGLYHLERRKNNGDAGDYFFSGHTNPVIGPGPAVYPKTLPFFPTTDAYQGGVIRRTPNQLRTSSSPGPEMTFTYEAPAADAGSRK